MPVSNNEKKFIFILGAKGTGKGTQAQRLVRDYEYTHISLGDLMRKEANAYF